MADAPHTAGASVQGLGRRLVLTYRYLGLRTMLWRAVTFPLRWTPLKLPLGLGTAAEQDLYAARRWQRRHAPPLATVTAGEPLAAPAGCFSHAAIPQDSPPWKEGAGGGLV